MSRVILINPFEVPEGREGEAPALWDEAAGYIAASPASSPRACAGHSPRAPGFTFIDTAEWETAEHFQAAIGGGEFRKLSTGSRERFPRHRAAP